MRPVVTEPVAAADRAAFLDALVPYLRELRPGWEPGEEWRSAYFDELLAEPNRWIWWAKTPEGQRVGLADFCAVQDWFEPDGWVGEVSELTIFPAFRRLGYGRALARVVVDELRRFGVRSIEATTAVDRYDVTAFWQAAGFNPRATVLTMRIGDES